MPDPINFTQTFALFDTGNGYQRVTGLDMEGFGQYVRLSEPVTLTFTPRNAEAVTQEQLDKIDALESQLNAEYVKAKTELERRRSELLALPHVVLEAEDLTI